MAEQADKIVEHRLRSQRHLPNLSLLPLYSSERYTGTGRCSMMLVICETKNETVSTDRCRYFLTILFIARRSFRFYPNSWDNRLLQINQAIFYLFSIFQDSDTVRGRKTPRGKGRNCIMIRNAAFSRLSDDQHCAAPSCSGEGFHRVV